MDFTLIKRDVKEGFAVKAATFNSLRMLKTFWRVLEAKHKKKLSRHAFYIKDEVKSQYHLLIAFIKDKQQAQNYCDDLAEKINLSCHIEEMALTI